MKTVIGLAELLTHLESDDPGSAVITGISREDTDRIDPRSIPTGSVVVGSWLGRAFCDALTEAGSAIFAAPTAPYEPGRQSLYTIDELFGGFDPTAPCTYCETPDARIYRHFVATGGNAPSAVEALSRRIHDHQITQHLAAWLADRKVVAIMGGHDMKRGTEEFSDVVELARDLARRGYTIATGGGPGAMEAAHLGAYLAGHPDAMLAEADKALRDFPDFKHERWLASAMELRTRLDASGVAPAQSIGVPTWTYGHEPPNAFATAVAKYFDNSIREDGLVSIASHGIVFTPGNAGTVQEIFQDTTQNHYAMVQSRASAMVFLGSKYWTVDRPVIGLLRTLSTGRAYDSLIGVADSPAEAAAFIDAHPPVEVESHPWSFCDVFCKEPQG